MGENVDYKHSIYLILCFERPVFFFRFAKTHDYIEDDTCNLFMIDFELYQSVRKTKHEIETNLQSELAYSVHHTECYLLGLADFPSCFYGC